MVKRLYVHNYRCLENFELNLGGQTSMLIAGRNGAGKSTVRDVLFLLQQVGRGVNRVGRLIKPEDFASGHADVPIRVEIDVLLKQRNYTFSIAFELPDGFRELRISEERLSVDGAAVYSRETSQISLSATDGRDGAEFRLDWHLIALTIIQDRSQDDPLSVFRNWLASILLLAPIPPLIGADSDQGTLQPTMGLSDLAEWFRELTSQYPASYIDIDRYLRDFFSDLAVISNPTIGGESRRLEFEFKAKDRSFKVPLSRMSDGEKCFLAAALVVAANKAYGPLLCFWDEPDNYIGLPEVNRLMLSLRKAFQQVGQFLATSHSPEAIRAFPADKTMYFFRESHLEPTRVKTANELDLPGGLADALIRDDVGEAA